MSWQEVARFEAKFKKQENGCWIWIAGKYKNGYGHYWANGKNIRAHRYAYLFYKKKDPGNLLVLHSCDTPACVNPEHLFLGTDADNNIVVQIALRLGLIHKNQLKMSKVP